MSDYIILSIIMFVAGFVDCLAGGGGIIRLPAFLYFGVPPEFVLGTNKLTSVMGAVVSAWQFRPNIKISRKFILQLAMIAFVFAAVLHRMVEENLRQSHVVVVMAVGDEQIVQIAGRDAVAKHVCGGAETCVD